MSNSVASRVSKMFAEGALSSTDCAKHALLHYSYACSEPVTPSMKDVQESTTRRLTQRHDQGRLIWENFGKSLGWCRSGFRGGYVQII